MDIDKVNEVIDKLSSFTNYRRKYHFTKKQFEEGINLYVEALKAMDDIYYDCHYRVRDKENKTLVSLLRSGMRGIDSLLSYYKNRYANEDVYDEHAEKASRLTNYYKQEANKNIAKKHTSEEENMELCRNISECIQYVYSSVYYNNKVCAFANRVNELKSLRGQIASKTRYKSVYVPTTDVKDTYAWQMFGKRHKELSRTELRKYNTVRKQVEREARKNRSKRK